jgi:hypothetical protein
MKNNIYTLKLTLKAEKDLDDMVQVIIQISYEIAFITSS